MPADFDDHERMRQEGETEQLRVAWEDAQAEIAILTEERDRALASLAACNAALREAEARLARPAAAAPLPPDDPQAEELRVAMEELQVFAEELEQANTSLARANAELEGRVAARTEALNHKNAELRDSEERLRLAQRYAEAGTWDWDIRSDRITWSEEYYTLYGLDPRQVTPSYEAWVESVHPQDRDMAKEALQTCLRDRRPDFAVEYRILHPRRGERWLAGRGRLFYDLSSRPVRMIGLNLDITDRKRAELALAEANNRLQAEVEAEVRAREIAQARLFQTMKLEALGQLTGGVAHDFNNLLAVITSGATLLQRTDDMPRRQRLTEAMVQAAQRGATLTRRLLTFARRQSLRPEPLDLCAWLEEARELLARTLRGDITIEIALEERLWPVLADPGELELALLNLAVNARDAMPKGGTLRLTAANTELDSITDPDGLGGCFLRLAVQDTGHGMPPEVLARVFEPFYSTKPASHGTGLGLPQVYGFARQSGGTARIDSQPGRGTTVTLLLPRAAEAPGAAAAPRPQAPARAMAPLRLLLAEDDDDVAVLTTEMLRHLGHDVLRAGSAAAALRMLEGEVAVDLLLTDVVMPGGQDGLDLARQVGALRPGLPILLYSGFGGAPARVAAAGLPLLRKPFTLEQLRQALETATRRSAPRPMQRDPA
ncbi:PAS domain-containing protein [Belnapia sp. T6]|uniref:histidine kinase n=1 Tax=Belnapia mucosa TaxID=2804532 RepID=A0ABS1V9U9_9PROT|nr:PAS domain-containing sensor histidine kinase [Belnapia mucosa]MBL6458456.1 PAS domain-containing protein [Belnapia mucosa]